MLRTMHPLGTGVYVKQQNLAAATCIVLVASSAWGRPVALARPAAEGQHAAVETIAAMQPVLPLQQQELDPTDTPTTVAQSTVEQRFPTQPVRPFDYKIFGRLRVLGAMVQKRSECGIYWPQRWFPITECPPWGSGRFRRSDPVSSQR